MFLKDSFRFFDYLFGTLIRQTFESQKEDNEAITPTSEGDGQLRNALLLFREDYANKRHIAPNRVFAEAVLNKFVAEKPVTSDKVRSILPPASYFHVGPQILKIIQDFFQGPLPEEK